MVSPLASHGLVSPYVIASLYHTRTPYTKVSGRCHIASYGITRAFVIVGFPDWSYYGMVNEVLSMISLSHLSHPESSSIY